MDEEPERAYEMLLGNTDMRIGGPVHANTKKEAKLKFALKLLQAEHSPTAFWNWKIRVVTSTGEYGHPDKNRLFFHPQYRSPSSGDWKNFGTIFRVKRIRGI